MEVVLFWLLSFIIILKSDFFLGFYFLYVVVRDYNFLILIGRIWEWIFIVVVDLFLF